MEPSYKVGDRVRLLDFYVTCRMGSIKYGRGFMRTMVKFPEGMSYCIEDLKRSCGRTVKVIKVGQGKAGVEYDVTWIERSEEVTFRIRPYLIECKVLSMIKCDVDDIDRARVKFNAKVLEKSNRDSINKRVLKANNKDKPKGKK